MLQKPLEPHTRRVQVEASKSVRVLDGIKLERFSPWSETNCLGCFHFV